MRSIAAGFIVFFSYFNIYSQESPADLLRQGIALHDKGDFDGAIKIYNTIIGRDDQYFDAYYEKSFSLYKSGNLNMVVETSKEIIKKFPEAKELSLVYMNYGSALDGLKKPDEAIRVYSKGIRKFPNVPLLYFNRGITKYFDQQTEEAVKDFKSSLSLNPKHASSHQFLAYSISDQNKIAGILALTTFLIIEPKGERAKKNLKIFNTLITGNVKKEEKNVTIFISPEMLSTNNKGDDHFGTAEMTLSMQSAMDQDVKYKDLDIAQNMKRKLETLAAISGGNNGFFSNFYLPFIKQLKENNHLTTACYVINTSANDKAVDKWLTENKDSVDSFNKWVNEYRWNVNVD